MEPFCPECGASVQDNLLYCPECGCPTEYIKTHQVAVEQKYAAFSAPERLLEAAKSGNPDAMYWLGWCFYYGDNINVQMQIRQNNY